MIRFKLILIKLIKIINFNFILIKLSVLNFDVYQSKNRKEIEMFPEPEYRKNSYILE